MYAYTKKYQAFMLRKFRNIIGFSMFLVHTNFVQQKTFQLSALPDATNLG